MKNYERIAYYHETDQMGVIHHSNYLKWMEEARLDFMNQLGYNYKKMEEMGVISPVLAVNVEYKKSVSFNDVVYFVLKIKNYNGIKLEIAYEMYNKETNTLCLTASSKHCFLQNGNIVSLKKTLPEFHNAFEKAFLNQE